MAWYSGVVNGFKTVVSSIYRTIVPRKKPHEDLVAAARASTQRLRETDVYAAQVRIEAERRMRREGARVESTSYREKTKKTKRSRPYTARESTEARAERQFYLQQMSRKIGQF